MSYAAPQKTWCPPLMLLRSPSAKECFCRSTYDKAGVGERKRGCGSLKKADVREVQKGGCERAADQIRLEKKKDKPFFGKGSKPTRTHNYPSVGDCTVVFRHAPSPAGWVPSESTFASCRAYASMRKNFSYGITPCVYECYFPFFMQA